MYLDLDTLNFGHKPSPMPRPKTKEDLLSLSAENYTKLLDYIDCLPPELQVAEFPEGTMNRNVRDILAHLHEWHEMMLSWYEVGMRGDKPVMPAEGYTWKTLPDLNRKIWEQYRSMPLPEARKKFEQSYQRLRSIIEQHSDEELFTKKKYAWTGTTSLGQYLVSATSSHYDWGLKLIRKAVKTLDARREMQDA